MGCGAEARGDYIGFLLEVGVAENQIPDAKWETRAEQVDDSKFSRTGEFLDRVRNFIKQRVGRSLD